MALTKISVVIPTLNAGSQLEVLIKALREQERPPDQILVIDSASTDQTREIARSLEVDLIKIERDNFDHGATRNLGAEKASGEVIIFMTQDAIPYDSTTFKKLIMPLQESEIVVSYARQIPEKNALPGEKFLRFANYPPASIVKGEDDVEALGIKTFQNSNVCAAYRRKEFEKLGSFPAPVVCNEDMMFAAKAILNGYKVAYCAEALVLHTHKLGIKQLFKRYFDIAASLDHEPRIKNIGRAEEKGLEFIKQQLAYLKDQNSLNQIPRTLLETIAKYFGYKAGLNHNRIPKKLKKHFGANKLYWSKVINK